MVTPGPSADVEDIDLAVKAARPAFNSGPWSNISPSERGRMMWRLADLLEKNLQEFAELERSEERRVGKECKYRWSPYH